ncbi:MAG: GGDEF domain-containing protein [Solirubrobacteraceae bacterium]|nr:GGDEF domain-containing protein [Solirubrobacteraceae bacterium]
MVRATPATRSSRYPQPLLRVLRTLRLIGYRPTEPETLARQISRQNRGKIITVGLLTVIGILTFPAAEMFDNGAIRLSGVLALLSAALVVGTPLRTMHPAWYHGLPILILAPWAVGVATLEPHGGTVAALFVFVGPTIAFVIEGRAGRVFQWTLAAAVVLGLALFADTNAATDAALLASFVCAAGLAAFIHLVWGTAEAQGAMLEQLVRRDPLTGVGNRRMLGERLDYEMARHSRTGLPLTLLVLDLNGFKQVNDRLGHTAGDDLLREVGALLTSALRGQDTVTRPGGDEFCIIAPETGAEDAARLVATIRGVLATVDAAGRPLTTAVGVATFPQDGRDPQTLLHQADARQRDDKLQSSVGLGEIILPEAFERPVPIELPASVPLPSGEEDHVPLSRRVSRQPSVRVAVMFVYLFGALAAAAGALLVDEPRLLLMTPVAVAVGLVMRFAPTDRLPAAWFHLGPLCAALVATAAVWAVGPSGYLVMPFFMFVGAAIGFMMETRRGMAVQTAFTTFLIALPLLYAPYDDVTFVAVVATTVGLWAMVLFIALPWRIVEEQAEELGRLMRRDPLTGVGNRRLLGERLDYELTRHARTGRQFALIVLDLNDFKRVNDTLGHLAGDEVLRAAATALRAAVRRQDTVTRQGGDEFCILAPEAGAPEAARIVRNVREALGDVDAGGGTNLAGAIGSAVFPDDATEREHLVEVADARQRADKGPRRRDSGDGTQLSAMWRGARADFPV